MEMNVMEMVQGQMYRLMVTGHSKENDEVVKTEYLMIGQSIEDIKTKFPYVVDISEFAHYRFDYVIKEPGKFHVLSTKYERTTANVEDATIKRDGGTTGVFQAFTETGKKFMVRASTTCFAKSEKHAQKKLGLRLSGGSESVQITVEEIHAGGGYAMPRDVSVFPQASFVKG